MVVEGFAGTRDQPRPDLVIHNLTQDDEETAVGTSVDIWRYMTEEEWEARQTTEEEFREIAAGMTHLGPRSARRATPYPRLPAGSTVT